MQVVEVAPPLYVGWPPTVPLQVAVDELLLTLVVVALTVGDVRATGW